MTFDKEFVSEHVQYMISVNCSISEDIYYESDLSLHIYNSVIKTFSHFKIYYGCLLWQHNISSVFLSNSEAKASELLGNLEEMMYCYWY